MERRLHLPYHGLTTQMVLSFMLLTMLTAVAAGVPAAVLIRNQLEQQAWAQVERGKRASEALYNNWQENLTNLATLTSQRPTLRTLIAQNDASELQTYLGALERDIELDLILVCNEASQPLAHTGPAFANGLCFLPQRIGYYHFVRDGVWLLAAERVGGDSGQVIVGVHLDDEFLAQMRDHTGLEHTLFVAGVPQYSSLGNDLESIVAGREPKVSTAAAVVQPVSLTYEGEPYYAGTLSLMLSNTDSVTYVVDEVALPVGEIVAAQRRLIYLLTAVVALAALLASLLGVLLARRISWPLSRLARAAVAFSEGNLNTPVLVHTHVREIAQVGQALEQARAELHNTIEALQVSNAWTDHLLQAIVEGIVTLDDQQRITFFSSGAERITGYSQQQAIGRHCDEIFRLVDGEPFSRFLPNAGKRQKLTLQLEAERQITVAVTSAKLSPLIPGESSVALVFRDVSETEIIHRLLGEFLANITHEFRTPLSALAASVELLRDQAPDLSQEELQALLGNLHLGILGLQTLIDNLLESASLEAGRFRVHPHPADLGEIISEATRTMRPLQEKYGHRLVVGLPTEIPYVQADSRRVVQVLVNLLSNAIKFSPDSSEISLTVLVHGDYLRLEVADRGPGVPSGYQTDIFRPFVHPGSQNGRSLHGAGLGLSVVKAIVEAHGGQVGMQDRAGGGSVFWLTLPVAVGDEKWLVASGERLETKRLGD